MRTAAICPTCATYENAVCVIYDGPTLSNINVPRSTNLQVALGSINTSIGTVTSLITNLAAHPFFLTTTGTSGAATLTGNVLNIPNYQPTFQDVITNDNELTSGLVFFTTGNANTATINNTNLTDDRAYELPDIDGTIALISDITLQNATSGTNKNLTDGFNFQGTDAGDGNTGLVNINAFGTNAASNNSGYNVNAFGASAGINNTFNNVNLFGSSAIASSNDQAVFSKNGGTQMARIGYGGITDDRLYTLPDVDGQLVVSVNNITPVNGNVTVPVGLPYLVYTALLTFNSPGGNVTTTVLQNTIGDGSGDGVNDIAWSGTGPYLATMTAAPFTLNKTTAVPSIYFGSGINYTLLGVRTSSSVMTFNSRRTDTGGSGGAFVSNIFVEIRVYP